MTMPEILRRKLMERIDIASEPDDGEVLEEIDGLILGEEETRYLPVAQKAELRRQLFLSLIHILKIEQNVFAALSGTDSCDRGGMDGFKNTQNCK